MPKVRRPGGIHAVLYALFDAGERLDRLAMRRQVEICLANGVDGVTALGLATEVAKLSPGEQYTVMDWVSEDVAGRVPVGFTIFAGSVAEQIERMRHAERAGADWVILQPPAVGQYGAPEFIDFFGRVADAAALPVAIQNAPAYLGGGLTVEGIATLVRAHPNISAIKAEGPAIDIARLIEATAGELAVFNGRGGLELVDNLRVGAHGLILAPDLIDLATSAYADFHAGRQPEAEATYERMLPAVVFVMQSIETLICYGKRLFAARAGLQVFDRAPALRASPAGDKIVSDLVTRLGPLRGADRALSR